MDGLQYPLECIHGRENSWVLERRGTLQNRRMPLDDQGKGMSKKLKLGTDSSKEQTYEGERALTLTGLVADSLTRRQSRIGFAGTLLYPIIIASYQFSTW